MTFPVSQTSAFGEAENQISPGGAVTAPPLPPEAGVPLAVVRTARQARPRPLLLGRDLLGRGRRLLRGVWESRPKPGLPREKPPEDLHPPSMSVEDPQGAWKG